MSVFPSNAPSGRTRTGHVKSVIARKSAFPSLDSTCRSGSDVGPRPGVCDRDAPPPPSRDVMDPSDDRSASLLRRPPLFVFDGLPNGDGVGVIDFGVDGRGSAGFASSSSPPPPPPLNFVNNAAAAASFDFGLSRGTEATGAASAPPPPPPPPLPMSTTVAPPASGRAP
eukprot:31036-Pelagococcus_subviridis.AAC.10